MRSRYAAFARGDANYLFRTWHPRTRPADVTIDEGMVWTSLEVTDTAAGAVDDDTGEVEFTAYFVVDGEADSMHARSHFERRAGRWVYTTDE